MGWGGREDLKNVRARPAQYVTVRL